MALGLLVANRRSPPLGGGPLRHGDAFEKPKVVSSTLRRGATGTAVKTLQLKLVQRGYLSRSDFANGMGVFGPRTETAVKRAQVEAGLPVTGVVDAGTTAALNAAVKSLTSSRPGLTEDPTDVFERDGNTMLNTLTGEDDDDDFTMPLEVSRVAEALRAKAVGSKR